MANIEVNVKAFCKFWNKEVEIVKVNTELREAIFIDPFGDKDHCDFKEFDFDFSCFE